MRQAWLIHVPTTVDGTYSGRGGGGGGVGFASGRISAEHSRNNSEVFSD